ncbi:LAME_0G02740g1_1 [Lachancea meyersii CBS 8951]|uniref:LAME_0G02740g1_1 n=1 Tax=Lachancea meyersii CBS 8951 TaxID=1266667 RepID=A0A1G4K675_9SACH|nr:LAME_0G02740g1_1 [Lachancea meyersii CBS 8951]
MTANTTDTDRAVSFHSKFFTKCEKSVLQDRHFSQLAPRTTLRFTESSDEPNPVSALDFHPTGSYVAYTRGDGSLSLWKLKSDRSETYVTLTQALPKTLPALKKDSFVSWNPFSGFLLAAINDTDGLDIYDASTGTIIKSLKTEAGAVYNMCLYDPSGKWLAVLTQDHQFLLFDADGDYELLWQSRLCDLVNDVSSPCQITSLVWSHDSSKVYAAFRSGEIKIYEVLTTGLQQLIAVSGHTGPVNCLKLDHTGSYLFAGGEDTICSIWDLSTMCCTLTINNFSDSIRDMDLSYDGSILALSSPTCLQIYALDTRDSIYEIIWKSKVDRPIFRFYPGRLAFMASTENDLIAKFHKPNPSDDVDAHTTTTADKRGQPDRKLGNGASRRRDDDAPPRTRFVRRSVRR